MTGRSGDEGDHPAKLDRQARAAEKLRQEQASTRVGLGLMVFGSTILGVPVIMTQSIGPLALLSGVCVIIAGGLLNDPKTFGRVADRVLRTIRR